MSGLKFVLRLMFWFGALLMVFSVVQAVGSHHAVAWRFAAAALLLIVGSLGMRRRYGLPLGDADASSQTYTYDPNSP